MCYNKELADYLKKEALKDDTFADLVKRRSAPRILELIQSDKIGSELVDDAVDSCVLTERNKERHARKEVHSASRWAAAKLLEMASVS